jgi:hypothetical protein
MQYFDWNKNNFKGVLTAMGSTSAAILQGVNYLVGASQDATTYYHGFLRKYPKSETLGDTISSSAGLGLHLFLPSVSGIESAYRYLQAFSDGTMRYLSPVTDAWTSLNSGYPTTLPFDYADFNYLDRTFWTNGRQAPRKWGRDWTAGALLQDKSNTAVNLSGIWTYTNGSARVTGISGLATTQLVQGSWDRADSIGTWYEVISILDNNEFTINTTFGEATYTTISGVTQKAATSTVRGRFVENWNNRLFLASGDISGLPIVGTALVGDTTTPLP